MEVGVDSNRLPRYCLHFVVAAAAVASSVVVVVAVVQMQLSVDACERSKEFGELL